MPRKSLIRLALPLVISFTLRFMFTLVDMVFLGMIDDQHPHGVAAIGLFIPIQTAFIAVWVGLSAGFTATISQAFGRRDERRVRALKRAMVEINVALVPLLLACAAVIWLGTPLLRLEPALESDFLTYSLILVVTMPFTGFLSIYPDSIVKAHHDTMSTMKAGLWSTGANLALNTLFVFGCGWGIAGVAMATALSRYAGFAYAMRRTRALEAERQAPGWDQGPSLWERGSRGDLLVLAVPGSLAYLLMLAEDGVFTALLTAQEDAAVYLASFAVYNRLTSLAIMPVVATGVAVLPFAARLFGEGHTAAIRADLRRAMLFTAGLVVVVAVPVAWIFPREVAAFLVEKAMAQAGDRVVWYLLLVPVGALAVLPFLLVRPVFEAIRQPRIGIRMSAIKSLGLAVPGILAGFGTANALGADPMLGILGGVLTAHALASAATLAVCRTLLADPQTPPFASANPAAQAVDSPSQTQPEPEEPDRCASSP